MSWVHAGAARTGREGRAAGGEAPWEPLGKRGLGAAGGEAAWEPPGVSSLGAAGGELVASGTGNSG
jgi:hypothetical protein